MSKKTIKCKGCGAEITKAVKFCPNCGAKQKKPITKKWWFWLLIVVFVFGAIGSCGSDTEAEPVATSPAATQAPTVEEVKPSKEEPEKETEEETEEATEEVEDNVSKEFKNALKKAKSYSDLMHMSKACQLVSPSQKKGVPSACL